ncbi:MAG: hypothetical protein KID07_08225 [Firmicutes bacterium]|nr:hypothetical protein [Bacillota bacterium]
MPKKREFNNVFNIVITAGITCLFVALGALRFSKSYLRLKESAADLWQSLAYYFKALFGARDFPVPSVAEYSEVWGKPTFAPKDMQGFFKAAKLYFLLLVDGGNAREYFGRIAQSVGKFSKIILIVLPCLVVLKIVIKRLYAKENTKHNRDTVPLKIFKSAAKFTYQPVKRFVREYIAFLRAYPTIFRCWAALWLAHLNFISIILEFFAYYFYFAVSFDVPSLYVQAVKLFADLRVPFKAFPWQVTGVIVWLIFNKWRKKTAVSRLRHFEARNCGFINELPIVSLACGSMGKKKTTLMTDMSLSLEVMFRQKALEILRENDMKFPYFPWICLEKELKKCMEHHTVYNLASVKAWAAKKRKRYEIHGTGTGQLYNYDVLRYGETYKDGLKTAHIFDVLETYAQAYFIYVIQSSLIVSNYAVRTDNMFLDGGNFPLWLTDFFSESERSSRHSHILDFDILRLGRKVIENNPKAGSFEFGVVAITEIGKERGNNLELKEIKKIAEETNQKNDLFNSWLKMSRHSATVDNFPFIKVFADEQRPESWGADARELAEVVTILSAGEQRIAMPFYTIEEMICEQAYCKFLRLYEDFRFRRGDNTLLVHILKSVVAKLWKHNEKIKNLYGYSVLALAKQRGTLDGKSKRKKYFLCNRKIYARRFTTDCFSDYFNDLAIKAKIGINDYEEYAKEKASVNELKQQHSYFIGGLYGDK